MKTKKFKMLGLNKETIVHLNVGAMKNLKGGGDTDICGTLGTLCCDTAICHPTYGETTPTFCTASHKPTDCVSGGYTDCTCYTCY